MKDPADVLITDLDNTLWDWVHIWHATFTALVDVLVEEGGLDRETLLDEARAIHQRHRTSEYFRLIEELPSFAALSAKQDTSALRKKAIRAAQRARENTQCLYPQTLETLRTIRQAGSLIVAYTESMAFATSQRVRKLQLDGMIHFLYSSPDHDLPEGVTRQDMRRHSDDYYELKSTEHRHVERGVIKPSVKVLKKIIRDVGADADKTVYVGDSLMKDIAMAQRAGVHDVLAAYGRAQDRNEYELLKRVTHWSPEDVEREKEINSAQKVTAKYALETNLGELLDHFDFRPHAVKTI